MAPALRTSALNMELEAALDNHEEAVKVSAAGHRQAIVRVFQTCLERIETLEQNKAATQNQLAELNAKLDDAAVERAEESAYFRQQLQDERSKLKADRRDVVHRLNEFRSSLNQIQARCTDDMKSHRDETTREIDEKIIELRSFIATQNVTTEPRDIGVADDDIPMGDDQEDDLQQFSREQTVGHDDNPPDTYSSPSSPEPARNSTSNHDNDDDEITFLSERPITDGDEDKAKVMQAEELRISPRLRKFKDPFYVNEVGVLTYRGNNYEEGYQLYGVDSSQDARPPTIRRKKPSATRAGNPRRQSTATTDGSEYLPVEGVSATPELSNPTPSSTQRSASDPPTLESEARTFSSNLRNHIISPTPPPTQDVDDHGDVNSLSAITVTELDKKLYRQDFLQCGNPRSQTIEDYIRYRKREAEQTAENRRKRNREEALFVSDSDMTPPIAASPAPAPLARPSSIYTFSAAAVTPKPRQNRGTTNLSIRNASSSSGTGRLADSSGNAQRVPPQTPSKTTSATTRTPVQATMPVQHTTVQTGFAAFKRPWSTVQSNQGPSNAASAQPAPVAPMHTDQDASDCESSDMLKRFRAEKRKGSDSQKKTKK